MLGEKYITSLGGYQTYIPPVLPPQLNYPIATQRHIEQATHLLGQVEMCRSLLPNVNILLYGSLQREAIASSTIEDTIATPDELILFQVTHHAEAGGLPSVEEQIHATPTVERHTKPVPLEHPEHLLERRAKPLRVRVAGEAASRTIAIPDQVRRISEQEVHAGISKGAEHFAAITEKDLVHGNGHVNLLERLKAPGWVGAVRSLSGIGRAHGVAGAARAAGAGVVEKMGGTRAAGGKPFVPRKHPLRRQGTTLPAVRERSERQRAAKRANGRQVDATAGSPWTRARPAQAPAVDWRRKMRRAIFPLQPCPRSDQEHARRALCTGAAARPTTRGSLM